MKKQEDLKKSFQEREIVYKKTFRSDTGEMVLNELKATLRYGETVYSDKVSELDLAFHLGRQSVINDIMFILGKPDQK